MIQAICAPLSLRDTRVDWRCFPVHLAGAGGGRRAALCGRAPVAVPVRADSSRGVSMGRVRAVDHDPSARCCPRCPASAPSPGTAAAPSVRSRWWGGRSRNPWPSASVRWGLINHFGRGSRVRSGQAAGRWFSADRSAEQFALGIQPGQLEGVRMGPAGDQQQIRLEVARAVVRSGPDQGVVEAGRGQVLVGGQQGDDVGHRLLPLMAIAR